MTRKVCPECRLANGTPVFQSYDEFIEKREVCSACGNKYVRQTNWEAVRARFFRGSAEFQARKEANLAELRKIYQEDPCDPRRVMKHIYDAETNKTSTEPLFATIQTEDERDRLWTRFLLRAADDNERRVTQRDRWARASEAEGLDPECTFHPAVTQLEANPALRELQERLEGTTFEERMEEDLLRRNQRREDSKHTTTGSRDHLPDYLLDRRGWLAEERAANKHGKEYWEAKGSPPRRTTSPSATTCTCPHRWEPKVLDTAENTSSRPSVRVASREEK